MRSDRQAFTLIELLVVVAILAILAGMLYPVFAAARERAHVAVCQSNLRQLGASFHLYLNDWDDTYPLPYTDHLGNSGDDNGLPSWRMRILPYVRSAGIFVCPSNDFVDLLMSNHDHGRDAAHDKGVLASIAEVGVGATYGMNGDEFNANQEDGVLLKDPPTTSEILQPADTILLFEMQVAGPSLSPLHQQLIPDNWDDPSWQDWRNIWPPYGSTYFQHYPDGRSNWLFCDGHVRMMRLIDTLVPRNHWLDPGYESDYFFTGARYQQYLTRIAVDLPPKWR